LSGRDAILASVRANLPRSILPLPAATLFDESPPPSLVEEFTAALARMGGRVVNTGPADDPLGPVRALVERSHLVCSATPEFAGQVDLAANPDPRDLADADHAVVRAVFGVAETGSVLLTDETLKVNALACLAQHLIVLLDPSEIVANLHQAYARPELGDRQYAVLYSGPSATADIEGVLILGALSAPKESVL
jgi:L-lactate dehydrogenase complex protein LldG